MYTSPSKSLAEIVNSNFKAATIFEKYNLDYCCKGKRSLREACLDKSLPLDIIDQQIAESL
jgi:regulator of cell morphogenesis and NO signaling